MHHRSRSSGPDVHIDPVRAALAALRATVLPAAVTLAAALAYPPAASACDTDADCGGGTCIKREKRASGVCYGARDAEPVPQAPWPPDAADEAPVTDVPVEIPAYVGNRDDIMRSLTPTGIKCMVTQQCPEGLECVTIEFQSTCMKVE